MPAININIAPGINQDIGGITTRAEAATRALKKLQQEARNAKSAGIVGVNANEIDAKKQLVNDLNSRIRKNDDAMRGDRQAFQDFRAGKNLGRVATNIARSLASGNILETSLHMMSTSAASRLANKLGGAGASMALLKAVPALWAMKEAFDAGSAVFENMKQARISNTNLRQQFADGKITAQTYEELSTIGSTPGSRLGRSVAGLLNEDWTVKGAREKILRETSGLEDRQLTARMQNITKGTWLGPMGDSFFGGFRKKQFEVNEQNRTLGNSAQSDEEMAQEIAISIRKTRGGRQMLQRLDSLKEAVRAQIEQERQERLSAHLYRQNDPDTPEGKETLARQRIDPRYQPNGKETDSERYRRENIHVVENAQWNVYKRGYVPLNRNE